MELTEERVREIVREEIEGAEQRRDEKMKESFLAGLKRLAHPGPKPPGISHIEAENLREMGLDPFEEAEKPKPDWMTCAEAAELRAAGTDPMGVDRDAYEGGRSCSHSW